MSGVSAPSRIVELVQRYEQNREAYESGQYKETQLRREFLDPFFEELGWDVQNRNNWSETYKEVIHEDSIVVGDGTRAPDYAFRVGGTRKFFVEAKTPSVNIRTDVAPSYQLRRYAWSAKLPLSILTDFGEFAVYDTRVRPNPQDSASTARTMYLTYRDYSSRWTEIAGIFHRDSVLRGSFDKYADTTKQKKGTAEVDDEFLNDIESWRESLAKNIALRNAEISTGDLNFAVQKIIDRIIFLRICEDRGIETYARLRDLLAGDDVYARLQKLFAQADDRYNSGLFHFTRERGRRETPDMLTPSLAIDDKPLKEIVRGLYYPNSPYEFSVLPAAILGNVYEQFLGKVIRLTAGHRAIVEDKPEVKKSGGVYYTPTYIVDAILRQTLGPLTEGKTPKQVARLRIVDPACGSGTFLIGAYQFLLDWFRDAYVAAGDGKRVYQSTNGEWRLTSAERKKILTQSIFGVDLDGQAVEVTKLSLLLKVLEGESSETINRQRRLFQERALPDLGDNIKAGNALVGTDFFKASLFDSEAGTAANPLDWESEFPEVFRHGGFDAVIGNPPYIRAQRIEKAQAEYLFSRYSTATSKADLSIFFIERALELINDSGAVGFISTSQWLSTDYGRKLRDQLRTGLLHRIIDFGSLPVFRASTYPAIFVLRRKRARHLSYTRIESAESLNVEGIAGTPAKSVSLRTLSDAPWNLRGFDVAGTLDRAGIAWKPLAAVARAYIGAKSGSAEAFVLTGDVVEERSLERELLIPYAYQANEIHSFHVVSPSAYLLYPYREGENGDPELLPEDELRRRYRHIHDWLLEHKDKLRNRLDSRRHYARGADWYRHLRPGSFAYIRPRKLSMRSLARRATTGWLEPNTAFDGANCPSFVLHSADEETWMYLLGLLNSKVVAYYLRSVCPPKLSGYIRFSATYINQVPLPDLRQLPSGLRRDLLSLVEQAQRESKDLTQTRKRKAIQDEIDAVCMDLYGLTAAERSDVKSAISDEL